MVVTNFMISFCLLASSIVFLLLSTKQRGIILKHIPLLNRRGSSTAPTPRPVIPEKKGLEDSSLNYKDVFPPSRRASLTAIPSSPSLTQNKLRISTISPQERLNIIVPLTSPVEDCNSPAFTPTEFSIEEIEALGDFPDYAELSGVPLPEPYSKFIIEQALPRPYRPFRWAYHQTMCRFSLDRVSPRSIFTLALTNASL
jgi:hypothetical protein